MQTDGVTATDHVYLNLLCASATDQLSVLTLIR